MPAPSASSHLAALARNATDLDAVEVIVVDAGYDGTMAAVAAVVDPLASRLRTTAAPAGGRGRAVNAGVRLATGEIIWCCTPTRCCRPAGTIDAALADPALLPPSASVQPRCSRGPTRRPPASVHGVDRPPRSTWYELPFGDQALATTARALELAGGYGAILEEYALVNGCAAPPAPAASSAGRRRRCSPRRWSARRARCGAPTPSRR